MRDGCQGLDEWMKAGGRRSLTSRPSFSIRAMHTVYSGLPCVFTLRSKMSKSQSSICDTMQASLSVHLCNDASLPQHTDYRMCNMDQAASVSAMTQADHWDNPHLVLVQ